MGFVAKPFIPAASHAARSEAKALAVSPMIAMWQPGGTPARIIRVAAIPSISGIMMSMMTAS